MLLRAGQKMMKEVTCLRIKSADKKNLAEAPTYL
jgi:hypothetical protein